MDDTKDTMAGIEAQGLIDRWKREYDEIAKHVKFGGADPEVAFEGLKRKINGEVNGYFRKAENWKKVFWFAVLATVCLFILGGIAQAEALMGAGVAGIVVCVVCYKAQKGCYTFVKAAYKFDEETFGGEIFYRRRNG